jgi:hypothetical protein
VTDVAHDKTPDTHSSIVGGSSAARILGCPGSTRLLATLPQSVLNESSKYADEGTALHEVMAYLVENDVDPMTLTTDEKIDELFAEYGVDEQRFFDAVVPAYREFNKLCDQLLDEGGPDDELRIRVECQVQMPGIDGAFGTTDILIRGPKRTVVWDWKFGAGVPVYASYKDGDQDFGNEQLMFYARAALETHPDYFEVEGEASDSSWPVRLVICQPRIGDGEPSWFDTDVSDLEFFRLDLIDAVAEATGDAQPRVMIGSYCRFAKCKTICPLHLGSAAHGALVAEKLGRLKTLQDQSLTAADIADTRHVVPTEIIPPGVDIDPDKHRALVPEGSGIIELDTGEMYAIGLHLKEILEPMLKGVAEDAQTFMEAGGKVPGYKLVPKKAGHDSWLDDDKAEKYLGRQGIPLDERRVVKPITPAVARTKLKALGKLDEKGAKQLAKYVDPGKSSGHTLAPESDSRPAIESTANAVASLAEKLKSSLLLSDD